MADNSVAGAAKQTVSGVRTFIVGQVDTQIESLGKQLHATSDSIRSMADHARQDPNVAASALVVDQASAALDRAAAYFQERKSQDVLSDLEAFSRSQPLVATFAATLVGFTLSRALKASSTRRFNDGNA